MNALSDSQELAPIKDPITSVEASKTLYPEVKSEAQKSEAAKSEAAPAADAAKTEAAAKLVEKPDDQKTDAEKPGEKPGEKPDLDTPYDLKLEEGFTADPGLLKLATTEFRKAGLSNEQVQAVANLQMQIQKQQQEQQVQAFDKQMEAWINEAKADKVYGGQAFDANIKTALMPLSKFGDPELRELLDRSGIGNHPAMIRIFYRIGKAMAEDTGFNPANSAGAKPREMKDVLYG